MHSKPVRQYAGCGQHVHTHMQLLFVDFQITLKVGQQCEAQGIKTPADLIQQSDCGLEQQQQPLFQQKAGFMATQDQPLALVCDSLADFAASNAWLAGIV